MKFDSDVQVISAMSELLVEKDTSFWFTKKLL